MLSPVASSKQITQFPVKKGKKDKRAKRNASGDVVRSGAMPTVERMQQNGGMVQTFVPIDPNSKVVQMVYKAKCECYLDAYLAAGKIDEGEYKAGMQYRMAWLCHVEGIKTHDSILPQNGGLIDLSPVERRAWAEEVLHEVHREIGLSVAQCVIVRKVCGCNEAVRNHATTLRRALDRWRVTGILFEK